jgi:hypothetical protein
MILDNDGLKGRVRGELLADLHELVVHAQRWRRVGLSAKFGVTLATDSWSPRFWSSG